MVSKRKKGTINFNGYKKIFFFTYASVICLRLSANVSRPCVCVHVCVRSAWWSAYARNTRERWAKQNLPDPCCRNRARLWVLGVKNASERCKGASKKLKQTMTYS